MNYAIVDCVVNLVRRGVPYRTKAAIAAAVAAAAVPAAGSAAPAGRVNFAIGPVTGTSPQGAQRRLTRGSIVNSGDTISTHRGRVQIRFNDGGYLSLKPRTEFRIDEFEYDKRPAGKQRSIFSLLRGGLRTLTGLIGKRSRKDYQLRTRVATIGIRGTGFSVEDLGDYVITRVYEGFVEMCNAAGCVVGATGSIMTFGTGDEPGEIARSGEIEALVEVTEPPIHGTRTTAGGEVLYQTFVAGEQTNRDGTTKLVRNQEGLADGPGYDLAISYGEGFEGFVSDVRVSPDVTAAFVGRNALVSYTTQGGAVGSGSLGSAVVVLNDTGVFANTIGWGRWTSGSTQGSGPHPMNFMGTQSQHYVVGLPTPVMPTSGQATYTLVGSTTPTLASGNGNIANHSLNSAELRADFASSRLSLDLNVTVTPTIGPRTFDVNNMALTLGAGAGLPANQFSGAGPTAINGSACASGCAVNVKGFFAGANAATAGLGYQIETDPLGSDKVNGVASFARQ